MPFAGTVTAVFGKPGERVPVGSPLIRVSAGVATAGSPADQPESSEYSGNVLIGYGTSAAPGRRRRRLRQASSPASADLAMEAGGPPAAERRRALAGSPAGWRDRGDLAGGAQAGPRPRHRPGHGARLRPVRNHSPLRYRGNLAPQPAARRRPRGRRCERIALTGLRGLAAERLARPAGRFRRRPSGWTWMPPRCWPPARALNAAEPDRPVSVLALVARFCVLGLRRYRELNSRIAADAVELLPQINLGFAAQTERGLLVPVVHGAQAADHPAAVGGAGRADRGRTGRSAQPGPADRRHLHRQQLRGFRGGRLGRDHQPPGGGDDRPGPDHRPALGAWTARWRCARSPS